MSDPAVAEFMAAEYVSTFQQAGDFYVERVNGQTVKNGGNVVSYFCTPGGRLIHAIGGPVDAARLLSEARWASEVFAQMQASNRRSKAEVLREAHQLASSSTQTSGQARNHQLLVKYAYAPMKQVEVSLFRTLAGETFEVDRSAIVVAAKAFAVAKKRNRPVLLFLHAGGRTQSAGNRSSSRSGAIAGKLRSYEARRYLKKFSVVHVPKIQLAAFTNLREISGWERYQANQKNGQFGEACLVVDPSSGEIITQLNLHASAKLDEELKSALESWGHVKSEAGKNTI